MELATEELLNEKYLQISNQDAEQGQGFVLNFFKNIFPEGMWEYGENKEETECPECDYTAKSKGVISDHICQKQTVAYEKPTCPHCGATFTKNLTSGNTLRKLPVIQNFFTISRMSEKKNISTKRHILLGRSAGLEIL